MAEVTLAVTGSIAAYKAADLIRLLRRSGHQVTVLMSEAAQQFISPLTLQVLSQRPVYSQLMEEATPGRITHIDLAQGSELFLVAPATAEIISQLAHGSAAQLITATALALPITTPKLLAPAMNTQMYVNPLVQDNLARLRSVGYQEIEPDEALLACGDYGRGALATLERIVKAVDESLPVSPGPTGRTRSLG